MKKIKYAHYCVAFLDILGFKNLVGTEDASTIHSIFNNIRYAKKLIRGVPGEDTWWEQIGKKTKIYFFSDSIVIAIPMSEPMALELVASKDETETIRIYNATVLGVQNYYSIATHVAVDFRKVSYAVMAIMVSQYHEGKGKRRSHISKKGNPLTAFEQERYGKCKMLRYTRHGKHPIYPISYVKPHPPISKKRSVCCYTAEGRKGLHDNLTLDKDVLIQLMKEEMYDQSSEFSDNRLSLFSAQKGKCAVTQRVFHNTTDIHCHHKVPKEKGGTDKYHNLVLILEPVHKLVHARKEETIKWYLGILQLTSFQIAKVNKLRETLELNPIPV